MKRFGLLFALAAGTCLLAQESAQVQQAQPGSGLQKSRARSRHQLHELGMSAEQQQQMTTDQKELNEFLSSPEMKNQTAVVQEQLRQLEINCAAQKEAVERSIKGLLDDPGMRKQSRAIQQQLRELETSPETLKQKEAINLDLKAIVR